MRGEIERTLKSEERTRLHKQWIERLKKKSFIRFIDSMTGWIAISLGDVTGHRAGGVLKALAGRS